ncbi:hypothetical protein F2Q69_00033082 [Brassica cretica]|uniref:Gnk2-homologous domain-containing protein n=1 Tax=Brassica cretica TaxID=69181 RepID=A0A8S9SHN6_BRACR|nr:hypothetical protein F2Q69_00033082 [Brassica cretica]
MIILASSLLFVLEVVNGAKCFGSLAGNSSYAQNRRDLFSTLANKVVTNGGFYNASLGQYQNRVYALGFCEKNYEQKGCFNCLESLTEDTQTSCGDITNSFVWSSDDEGRFWCLVRSSNQSFGNLELIPPLIEANPDHIGPSIDMTLFMQQWESAVNKTLETATQANTSSVHKYYSAIHAHFTEFPNVNMAMQCTPDITSQDCKQCLGDCVEYFREQFRGRAGGMASFPSCLFRWDNVTTRNIEDFLENFKDDPTVKIPGVYKNLCGPRVLVMEWIDGIRCTDPQAIKDAGLDLNGFLTVGVSAALRQLLEFGLFHGDPHPGNIFAMQDGRIAYVDFGNVAVLSQQNKQILIDAVVHAVNEDYGEMANDFTRLGFLAKGTDVSPIVPALEAIWQNSAGKGLADFNFRSVTGQFNKLVYDFPIRIPERFSLVIRSLLTQEGKPT